MHSAKFVVSLLLAAATWPPAAVAATPLKLLTLDDMSCVAWTKTKPDPEQRQPYLNWLRGFLSGHNYAYQTKQVAVVSDGTIAVYVDRHCAEKPTTSVADAAMRMSDQYSGRNAPITK